MRTKKLYLEQRFNSSYMGKHTPNEEQFKYCVVKTVNVTTPHLGEVLTRSIVETYCANEEWEVIVE